ncbi:hypothetical protein ASPZODRAFT_106353 [Penicilliopsis zonata CBS 506.65]|uniref:Amino-acid N-acetyltransferase subunit Mak10 n=1 Tax=Penicilliopsis zonata CBS 506.65 TaxID=1073090 RepID=A0A1L9STZ8_9EURO|nr:hypothetical protein ASPZODRAFT_106353 [Penicilliopsis zonata CBS 506.65]OJJ50594.1 hypothetical protein ASPZODRAFT_106353 [Penicilliopsis zonata CBS 506.65]
MLPNSEIRSTAMRVVTQSIVPHDITEHFTQAASKLVAGQLVKDEYFTLFEAVGALEIMDPKMDSGFIAPGEDLAEALQDSYDVTQELRPEQVVGIMDGLLCHEMAWHMGHPLSQTLFTSIYLDKLLWPIPKTMEQATFSRETDDKDNVLVQLVLRAYCLGLVKACDLVHGQVVSEYFYEEEDFVTQLYNRSLLSEFDVDAILKIINQALDWVDGPENSIDDPLTKALRVRLLFRRDFLTALEQNSKVLQTRSTKHLSSCISHISALEKSSPLGQAVPEAFSLKIQRKLASTVPPRPMVNISIENALSHLRRLCQDAIDIQQVLEYSCPYNVMISVWTLMSRKPQPSVYIRSLLQTIVFSDMRVLGSLSIKNFMYDDLAQLVLPHNILLQANMDNIELPSDPRFRIAQQMDDFVKRFSQPFLDTFRSICLNRCRFRRTLCHTAVDWDTLQMEAEELDTELRALTLEPPLKLHGGEPAYSYPLSSWAYHQKLTQLRTILQLGFELSIYAPEELPGMYWYLSHICSAHLAHIDRIRTFTLAASRGPAAVLTLPGGTKANASEREGAFHTSLRLLERLTTQLIAIDAFAIALHALYVLLARHGVLPRASSPNQAYSSERLRYELRMKPFLPISLPEPVPYAEYRGEADLEGDSDATVLERATRAIAEARKAWETILARGVFLVPSPTAAGTTHAPRSIEEDWKREVKDTMRACIGTSIAIESIKKALAARSSEGVPVRVEIPELGSKMRWHDWWAVPHIVPRS